MPIALNASNENPYGPLVNFQTEGVFPPSAVYVSPDDSIVMLVRNPTTDVTLHLSIRMLTPQGEVKATHQDFIVPKGAGNATPCTLPPSEGFLLSATVYAPVVSRGQCFVKVFLAQGPVVTDATLGALLCQGYVSDDDRLGYPQSPTESSLNGRGWVHGVVFASTPFVDNWSIAVPDGARWNLKSVSASVTVSAAPGNRQAVVNIHDPIGGLILELPQPYPLPATTTTNVTWGDGLAFATGLAYTAPLVRDFILGPGWIIKGRIDGFAAGDSWVANIGVNVEEYVAK